MNEGVSPLLMAQAFSTFPNNGVMVEAHSIQRIEDVEGEVIAKWHSNATRVTTPLVAQKITYMLKGVVEEGTGRKAQVEGLEVAGKTGTSELHFASAGGSKDHWFVGYTPQLVGAVWMGYDQTDENHYLLGTSGSTVTRIFKAILSESITEFSQKEFDLSLLQKQLKNQREEEEKQRKREEKDKEKQKEEGEKKQKEEKKKQEEAEKKQKEEEKKKEKEEKKRAKRRGEKAKRRKEEKTKRRKGKTRRIEKA